MKKIMIILVISLITLSAKAQVEFYTRINKGENIQANINIYGEKKISKKINLTYFALVEKQWAEGFVGLAYYPKDWINVGIMVGIEQNPALYRFAGSLWTGKGKNSLLILWEKGDGSDNYWYKITASHQFSDYFSLGIRTWRFHGNGPVITYTVPKSGISLFIMPAYDFKSKVNRIITGFAIKINP